MSGQGKLWLVGTGPGDPELLTLKAVRVLTEVDCVAYPHKPDQTSRALSIAAPHLRQGVTHLPTAIPMQVARAPAQKAYDELAADLRKRLEQGQSVAYLCEGDPLFYGSAMYLLERLDAVTEIEIVPGVSALNATAARARQPLAARTDVLKIVPGTLDEQRLERELANADSIAIIKPGRHFDRIRDVLERTGHGLSAVVVEDVGGARERVTSLVDFGPERPYFALILSYRGAKGWRDKGTSHS